jgi:DNA-binding response OmpR family regulator
MGSAYPLTGRSILVVEDEPLIAFELQSLFEGAGAKVRSAQTLRQAVNLTEEGHLSAAVLDYGLGAGDVSLVCRLLAEREVPFMFYSGYAQLQDHPKALIVQKPATSGVLLAAISTLVIPSAAMAP